MKLMQSFLVLLCAVLVKSVPLDQGKPLNSPRALNFYQNTTVKYEPESPLIKFKTQLNQLKQAQQPKLKVLADEVLNYRLPTDTTPIRYDLWLKTDVDKAIFEFSGRVKIHIKVVVPTQQITLHHRQLTIDNIDLLAADKALVESNLDFEYDSKVEFLKVLLSRTMTAGEVLILDISYRGTLRSDSSGFYRSSYQRNDVFGETVWLATTQFEHTDSRHGMPCYDEPGIRAVTSVQIQHDKSYNAISNMPIISRETVEGTDYVTSKFEDTPPMQTYLLAFVISDFGYISNNEVDVPQRVFAKPQSIARGDADFALSVVDPILRKYQEHFGINYPLPKMDHVAISDYIWGAMENFGLVTYLEERILYNPETAPNREQALTLIQLVGHEYAHQYFGNIVSPKWWTYTWLSEGFARFYECYINSLIFPENDHMERFRNFETAYAFMTDNAEYNTVPMNHPVESPAEIFSKFNQISYQKGGSVIRMFQQALGVSTFTKGLSYYLNEMYYNSATPDDLHRSLQKAYDEDFPGNNFNIAEHMKTWEDQAGYPVVHVERTSTKFRLIQKRSDGGDEIYSIPLLYVKSVEDFKTDARRLVWMDTKTIEIEDSSSSFLILNAHLTGYYKVSYSWDVWLSIINSLESDPENFPTIHRAQFFDDMLSQLNDVGDSSLEGAALGLTLMPTLKKEMEYLVWEKAYWLELFYSEKLFGTMVLEKYQEFAQSLYQPLIDRLGITSVEGESLNDASLRGLLLFLSCKALNQDCLTYQYNLLKAFVESGKGSFVVCDGLRLADKPVFNFVAQSALNNPETRYQYLFDLGCSLEREFLKEFLQLSLDTTNNFEVYERIEIIEKTASKSVVALEVVLDFIHENFNEIEEK